MNKIKAMVLAFAIILLPFNIMIVNAEENKQVELEISSKNAEPNSSVEVEVSIKNNPGVLGGTFELTYDSGLNLKAVNNGEAFSSLTLTKPGVLESGCKFVWDGTKITNTEIKNGTIIKLTFDIDDSSKAGDQYNISFKCLDAIDNNLEAVDIKDGVGKVSIIKTNVDKVLEKIEANKVKTVYNSGEQLNTEDITVTAYYDDSTNKVISTFDTNSEDVDMDTAGEKKLIISYTENNVTKKAEIIITVNDKSTVNNAKIVVDSNVVLPGDKIDINFTIDNNPGILGITLKVQYDAKLTLLSAQCGEAFEPLTMTKPGVFTSGCKFTWDGTDLTDENVKNGNILTLTFQVDETAQINDKYIISTICEDAVDKNLTPVKVISQSGAVTIGDSSSVVKNELTGLEISKEKTEYKVNDKLTLDDLKVVASYNGGVTETVTDYKTNIDEIDMSKAGSKTLKVFYTDNDITKSAEITITVATKDNQNDNLKPDKRDDNSTQDKKDNPPSSLPIEKHDDGDKTTTTTDGEIEITDDDGVKYYIAEKLTVDKLTKDAAIADKASAGKYKISSVAQKDGKVTGGTVVYIKPYNNKSNSASVKDYIKLCGVKFKVTVINKNAFKTSKNIKKVTIGKNVTKIGANAFYGCKKLSKITVKSTNLKSVGKNAIKGINKKATIKVPKKKLSKYKKLFNKKTGYKKTMKIKK